MNDHNSGEFSCPHCGQKEFIGFKKWLSRVEYTTINNYETSKTKYIFYKNKNRCSCCLCCFLCCNGSDDLTIYSCTVELTKCRNYIFDIVCFPCYLITMIIYLLFCSIGDLLNLCTCHYLEYEDLYHLPSLENIDKKDKKYRDKFYVLAKTDNDLWNYCTGFTEKDWKNYSGKMGCKCGYSSDTFVNFLKKTNENNETNITISNSRTKIITEEETIAINFTVAGSSYPIHCKLTDKFSSVKRKFNDKYPEFDNKNCYFLANGLKLNPNLSLAQQGFNYGSNIIVQFHD